MSKLLKMYEDLKEKNSNCLYLFKSGIFFIAINDDAYKLSDIFNFKITKLNDMSVKCGFPEKKIDFYSNILDKCSVEYKLIDINSTENVVYSEHYKDFIKQIAELNIDNLDVNESHNILQDLKNKATKLLGIK